MTDQPRPQGQLDVQRWLGRCMLRLQQYERLMKTLLAHHELAGPADTLEAQRAANLEKVSDKTLGTLVKSLFESYAVPDGFERELLPEDKVPTDRISMAISYRMTMAPERLAEVRAQIEELVVMRNELVHHFIERFDLWSDLGCEAALHHLEHCYQRIDHHHNELVGWAKTMDEARAHMAAFAETDVFHDMVVNGIAPDGTFDWTHTGIVRVLREASEALSEGGLTRLDRARDWIAAHHPDQTPSKYGCRTWPQVLSESKLFELVYRVGDDGKRVGWFRERLAS
ncbi:OST-HTH/LOTUS domain-containing protein [Hydrogenophaga sp.]|uniref:OST-HTH/LOTUS domain-containing protein n=1 Tax=Hydrogenophaga sp. TaxID=1904254 RepID=UPI0035B22D8C